LKEHQIQVQRTARYWTLGDPAVAEEVWVVLHGYNQLGRRFLRRFEPINDGRRLIVAPDALSRFYVAHEPGRHGSAALVGATWMTREDRLAEIADYVGYLDRLADSVREEVRLAGGRDLPLTVLGFSQGVATAARWVTQGSARPKNLYFWGDFTPPDLDLPRAREAFSSADVVMIRGTEDHALDPLLGKAEKARLAEAEIAYRTVTYPGRHDIDAEALLSLVAGKITP
jgi:predicted esterase